MQNFVLVIIIVWLVIVSKYLWQCMLMILAIDAYLFKDKETFDKLVKYSEAMDNLFRKNN